MSHVFPRHSRSDLPTAVGGKGCYLIDSTGKQYFDGSGGAAVSCLGHGDPDIIKAIQDQAGKLSFAHTGFFTSEPAEDLAELLIQNAPENLDRVYLVSGGSEATEAALKLARQYYVERGEPQRARIIARRQSYHGNTLGSLAAGGNVFRRNQFAPLLVEVSHISPCYEYIGRCEEESSHDYGQRVAQELEDEIQRLGPETVMAFIAEPVVGATLGAVPAVKGYLNRIRDICDRYGVLLIFDEVMCGMGRTGYMYACEADQVAPDILCIAKGLGAGYQPIGAMLCSNEIYQTIAQGSGFFQHGHTYIGHPVASAAALAVVKALIERDLFIRVKQQGKTFEKALRDTFGKHDNIGDIRGRGLFWGIELVADQTTKTPLDPAMQIAKKIKAATFDEGLICYPNSGTRDGKSGDHILLAPPFIITDEQISEVTEKLGKALKTVLA